VDHLLDVLLRDVPAAPPRQNVADVVDLQAARCSQLADDADLGSGDTCPVCLDDLCGDTAPVARLNSCKHLFHTSCLELYLQRQATNACPVCRTPLEWRCKATGAPLALQDRDAAGVQLPDVPAPPGAGLEIRTLLTLLSRPRGMLMGVGQGTEEANMDTVTRSASAGEGRHPANTSLSTHEALGRRSIADLFASLDRSEAILSSALETLDSELPEARGRADPRPAEYRPTDEEVDELLGVLDSALET